ncbi:unnamed protein product [Callosobruchus maculatus]|uniref:Uncharacterized protein n=1 Tax=Callosobruchus maculatus TaxID=64391 RepID=A0A653CFQ2_CALMS|nr:unnamed protein product [Callosobruchus maculatus]
MHKITSNGTEVLGKEAKVFSAKLWKILFSLHKRDPFIWWNLDSITLATSHNSCVGFNILNASSGSSLDVDG